MIVKVKASTWRSNSWDVIATQGSIAFTILEGGSTKERAKEVAKMFAAALSKHNAEVIKAYFQGSEPE